MKKPGWPFKYSTHVTSPYFLKFFHDSHFTSDKIQTPYQGTQASEWSIPNILSNFTSCNSWHRSVQFSHSAVSDCLWPHGLQHARLPCPSPTPGACSNSCPSNWWCHPAISSSVVPFSSCLQYFPSIRAFSIESVLCIWRPKYRSFSVSIGASASVLPMNMTSWTTLCQHSWQPPLVKCDITTWLY